MNNKTNVYCNDAIILICSTPHSKRIPEKCFKLINGRTALEHILDRIKPLLTQIPCAILTPVNISNNQYKKYIDIMTKHFIDLYQGSDDSPLHRMAEYIEKEYKNMTYPKYVIRITHDDLIIDDLTILQMIEYAKKENVDYLYCPTIINGAGVEVINTHNIIKAAEKYKFPIEHISYFVKFGKVVKYVSRETINRDYRLTLDYPKDNIILEIIFRNLGNNCTVDDICAYLDKNPSILKYNKQPDITLYTCVYNGEKYIEETIKSICIAISMSNIDIEYIVIDDDSNDRTLEKVVNMVNLLKMNSVKIVVNEHNVGLASSSNIALSKARGKYVMRVDADDMLCPYSLSKMFDKIKAEEAFIVYPDYYEIKNDITDNAFLTSINGNINHHAGCAIMDKNAVNELRFKEGIRHWDSLELYRRIKNQSQLKISYLHEPLFYYRKHDKNMSNISDERNIALQELKNAE